MGDPSSRRIENYVVVDTRLVFPIGRLKGMLMECWDGSS